MYIKDLNGCLIQVTDLDAAIAQADEYRHARHEDKRFRKLDDRLNQYWQHIYEELQILKQQQS